MTQNGQESLWKSGPRKSQLCVVEPHLVPHLTSLWQSQPLGVQADVCSILTFTLGWKGTIEWVDLPFMLSFMFFCASSTSGSRSRSGFLSHRSKGSMGPPFCTHQDNMNLLNLRHIYQGKRSGYHWEIGEIKHRSHCALRWSHLQYVYYITMSEPHMNCEGKLHKVRRLVPFLPALWIFCSCVIWLIDFKCVILHNWYSLLHIRQIVSTVPSISQTGRSQLFNWFVYLTPFELSCASRLTSWVHVLLRYNRSILIDFDLHGQVIRLRLIHAGARRENDTHSWSYLIYVFLDVQMSDVSFEGALHG